MSLKTVGKIGPLLDLFSVARPEWTLKDVADALGMARSTAHALLASVVDIGLLESHRPGVYALGDRITELNVVRSTQVDIAAMASDVLMTMARTSGETCNLGILRGDSIVYLETVAGHQNVTVTGARPGTRLVATDTAIGQAILGHRRRTSSSHLDAVDVLDARSRRAQSTVAFDLGAVSPEVRCVAAPIIHPNGSAIAAISLSTTALRFDRNRSHFAALVIDAVTELNNRLANRL